MPEPFILIASGLVVGLALGLTGGGGSNFAVPLLIYVVGLTPAPAMPVSLAAAGGTVGTLLGRRWAARIAGPRLQQAFAGAVVLVALAMLIGSLAA